MIQTTGESATMIDSMVFRVGGEGGEGVISTGEFLTTALAHAGYEIYSYRTYPAEIKGGHANLQVRTGRSVLLTQGTEVDVLLAFNTEAYEKHVGAVRRETGVLVYDSDEFEPDAQFSGIRYAVPMTSIAVEQIGLKLAKNMVGLGAVSGLFGIPLEEFEKIIGQKFGKKGDEVVRKNLEAVRAGHRYATERVTKHDGYLLSRLPGHGPELILSGNQALCLGALTAGLRFYAGYPITPATDIMEFLAVELPKVGGAVVQTEDEIAAIGAVLGSSFGGTKAMTATSGPGLSLMVEMLGLAVMAEIPAVVVDVQRAGPSTGMPTKTEQGDLYLAVYGGHGSCPRVVVALSSVQDCYYGIIRAFNIAEQYQLPVVVLSDQYLGFRKATVPRPDPGKEQVINRLRPTAEELQEYRRYRVMEDGISPVAVPGTPGGCYVATGLEHTELGNPVGDPDTHIRMTAKRYNKFARIEAMANSLVRCYGDASPEIGVIGWGSTEGVIREAVEMARARGLSVGALHPKILYPRPMDQLSAFIHQCKRVIIPECNYSGQFATLLRKRFAVDFIQLNKYNGLPFTAGEICSKILEVGGV